MRKPCEHGYEPNLCSWCFLDRAMTLFAEGNRHPCSQGEWSYESTRHADGVRRCDACHAPHELRFASLREAARHLSKVTPEDAALWERLKEKL